MPSLNLDLLEFIYAERDPFRQANFLEGRTETEHFQADREISLSVRNHKFEQFEPCLKQAKLCHKRIEENRKLNEMLERQRDHTEKRMHEI